MSKLKNKKIDSNEESTRKKTPVHCRFDEMIDVDELKPHPKNRNSHPKDQIQRLAKILKYQGLRAPIIINKNKIIHKGHGTLLAIKENKWDKAPVVYQEFESEEQAYAFVQSDNSIAMWSDLDIPQITLDLDNLPKDFDIDLLGIKNLFINNVDPGCDEDEVPEKVEPKTKIGDLYSLGNHRLLCGDSSDILQVEKLMDGEKSDMVFTDPPYGVSYEKKTQEIANQSRSRTTSKIINDDLSVDDLKKIIQSSFSNIDMVLADKSCYYVCSPQGGELGLMMMMMMQEANLICRHMIIWVKNAPVFSMNRLDYDYKHEPILFGWSKNRTHHKIMEGEFKNSVWEVSREPNKQHPTMKPTILAENAIKNSCPHGGKVIDLFGGSGSTLIACEKTNRKCYMMELDPHYCDVIVSRWEKYTGKKAELLNV